MFMKGQIDLFGKPGKVPKIAKPGKMGGGTAPAVNPTREGQTMTVQTKDGPHTWIAQRGVSGALRWHNMTAAKKQEKVHPGERHGAVKRTRMEVIKKKLGLKGRKESSEKKEVKPIGLKMKVAPAKEKDPKYELKEVQYQGAKKKEVALAPGVSGPREKKEGGERRLSSLTGGERRKTAGSAPAGEERRSQTVEGEKDEYRKKDVERRISGPQLETEPIRTGETYSSDVELKEVPETMEQGLLANAGKIEQQAQALIGKAGLDFNLREDVAQAGKLGFLRGYNAHKIKEETWEGMSKEERKANPGKEPTVDIIKAAMKRSYDRMRDWINKERAQGRAIGETTKQRIKADAVTREKLEQEHGTSDISLEEIAEESGQELATVQETYAASQAQLKGIGDENEETYQAYMPTPEEQAQTNEIREKIDTALEKLDLFGDDKVFIEKMFGLGLDEDGKPRAAMSQKKIAKEISSSEDKVKARQKDILAKLMEDETLKELIEKSAYFMDLFKSVMEMFDLKKTVELELAA